MPSMGNSGNGGNEPRFSRRASPVDCNLRRLSHGRGTGRSSRSSGDCQWRTCRRPGRRLVLGNARDVPIEYRETCFRHASPIQLLFNEEQLFRFARSAAALGNGRRTRWTNLLIFHLRGYERYGSERRCQAELTSNRYRLPVGNCDAEHQNQNEKNCRVATGEHVSSSAGEDQMQSSHHRASMVHVRAPYRFPLIPQRILGRA
jgi:hypothetical protein